MRIECDGDSNPARPGAQIANNQGDAETPLDRRTGASYPSKGEQKANPMPKPVLGKILVGPAGWSYADWEGIVYPRNKPRGFHEAAYLAQYFDTIEINTSFYNPLRPDVAASWVEKVQHNAAFRFTAKLWKRFTHERNANLQDEKACKQGIEPLAAAGRLGALLIQFPWSFKNTRENHEYMSGLFMQFMEYPLVVEVRHSSWNHPEVFDWLRGQGVAFCNIDQPVIGHSLAPSEHVTMPLGYVRLHGRNYEHWFTSNERPEERYNYLYGLDELHPWAERIGKMARAAEVVFVIANNHFEGKAIANALQLISLLHGPPVRVPETLRQRYPQLAEIAQPAQAAREPQQSDLFASLPSAVKNN
jgi:uncharacterized protein YecE (DUF72 family)